MFRAQDLFTVQAGFDAPRDHGGNGDDPVPFLNENRDVFAFGFHLGDDRPIAEGDRAGSHGVEEWRPVAGPTLEGEFTRRLANQFSMSMGPD